MMGAIETDRIFSIGNDEQFLELALEIFRFQADQNPVYKAYLDHLGIRPGKIETLEDIPFLPIEFFKEHRVMTGDNMPGLVFESSGTTGTNTSKHYICDLQLYHRSFTSTFRQFYGDPSTYCILALLPSYLERKHSSLVYMADELINLSGYPGSGFYLNDYKSLIRQLETLEKENQSTLLLGVSFALLDLAEQFPMELKNTIVMETGGMKGRREEITRQELHERLCLAFRLGSIHSEYGMTELLSQAYSKKDGVFHTAPWMKVLIRDPYDPFSMMSRESSGGINIIDLANLYSCSFIATQDIGKCSPDEGFEVLGRFENSDIRGCNLMLE
jgi:phenylacetate-coenzyme A ligase PaaK-like adenylate-forming protein